MCPEGGHCFPAALLQLLVRFKSKDTLIEFTSVHVGVCMGRNLLLVAVIHTYITDVLIVIFFLLCRGNFSHANNLAEYLGQTFKAPRQ